MRQRRVVDRHVLAIAIGLIVVARTAYTAESYNGILQPMETYGLNRLKHLPTVDGSHSLHARAYASTTLNSKPLACSATSAWSDEPLESSSLASSFSVRVKRRCSASLASLLHCFAARWIL